MYAALDAIDAEENNDKGGPLQLLLRESYASATATFFARGAPMELNLPATTLKLLPAPPLPSADHEWPVHPRELAHAKTQATNMLKASLGDFVRSSSGNSGRDRGIFALFAGLVFCAIGLAPILLSFLSHRNRWLVFGGWPCIWLGITTIIAGLHGVRANMLHDRRFADPTLPGLRCHLPVR